ncbi:hypothetical protein N8I77_006357 [Diaporthe amygdali]|uniref:Chromo domain-containing protein n=1 Tax=Phomopsis amygdali TaxID=1214568 RepID=A0AAD9SGJ5_PHOAM|nr:hypothetical protein N8I77_006357 [Diaporthe amygdali]
MHQRSDLDQRADDDSDSISLTSIDDDVHDPDTEFVVEDIHCERVDPADGILKYLVEWSNFPIDECTWEPVSGISEILKRSWEDKKATQDPRIAEEYEREYEDAFNKVLDERRELHRRRNAKRRKLGLDETRFCFRNHFYSDTEDDTELPDEDNNDSRSESGAAANVHSEEVQDGGTIDHKAESIVPSKKVLSPVQTQKSMRPNKIFTVDPSAAQAMSNKGKDKKLSRPKSPATAPTNASIAPPKARSNSTVSSRQRDQPSATGYQGSARRASTGTVQAKTTPRGTGLSGEASTKTPASTPTLVRKGLTAKKSGKVPIAATNIFTDGRKRQPRQNLASAMVDPSKDPKFFKLHRFRRKAELRSRDHDDQAPDVSKVADQLFSIGHIPPPRQTSAQNTRQSGDGDGMTSNLTDEATIRSNSTPSAGIRRSSTSASEPKSAILKRTSFDFDADRSKKKAKTVRFTGEDGDPFVSEPLGLDETPISTSRIRSPPPPPGSPSPPPEPKTKLSLATYHSRTVQNVEKKIVLATGYRSLDVTFHNVPKDSSREADQQWLREFCDADRLQFRHTVLAESIIDQLSQLRSQDPYNRRANDVLCSGKVTSASSTSLEVLAEHLRVGHSGLFMSHENYNLVIYPTRCDGFQMDSLGIEPSNSPEVALRHFVFRSSHNIFRLIRPLAAMPNELTDAAVGKGQKAVFRSLLGMQYERLVAGPSERREHHFFLAFPDAALDWYRSISTWLYACNPECKIFTSWDPGSWSAFLEKANNQCGVVVIHEAVVDYVRRFPAVAEILQIDKNYSFWRFSTTMGLQQVQSSEGSTTRLTPDVFSRLFPIGKAILVTPSFIVSEPQKVLQLFEWFFGNQTMYSSNKLVTAYNIVDFLRDLAGEANQLQTTLKQQRGKYMSELEAADQRNAAALSDQDLIARAKAWIMAEDWLSVSMERNGILSEENHVIFADRSIDQNDEQSLVNWFGWWSLAKVDKYRKFYVLGSSPAVKQTRQNGIEPLSRACRSVRIPNYERSVVNDPNEALRIAMKGPNEATDGAPANDDGRQIGRMPTLSFQSQKFANYDHNIQHFLRNKDKPGSVRIYGIPVSWVDVGMADHFGDPKTEFATLKQWFSWPYPWLGDSHQTFNTYIAFFYTIEEEWDPSKFPRGLKPKRHPWLVIYRPWEPHVKWERYRHGKMELIFWDVRAGNELENNHSLRLSDLNWMQREVVKFMQAHGTEKNPGSRIDRVWLGGFRTHLQRLSSTLPADMTAEFLEPLSTLSELKWMVPSSDGFMRQNGWREVSLTQTSTEPRAGLGNTNAFGRDSVDDQNDGDYDEETRIIFHPPRGSSAIGPPHSSRCTNDLFEQARLARLRDSKVTTMSYTFKPTIEWYADLVAEGRQYEHIYVDRWEKVFDQLRIGQKRPRQAGSISRKGSGSSTHSSPMDMSPV